MVFTFVRSFALIIFLLFIAATGAGAAPVLSTSTFEDGTQVDTAVVGTRVPVVLIHGLGGSTDGWDRFLHAYQQNPSWRAAFKPYSFRYSSSTADVLADPTAPRSLTGLGGALRDAMQGFYDKPASAPDFGFGAKRVIVLAHSMGGVAARSMMQEHTFRDGQRGGQKVLHLITLGTPHHGTPLADTALVLGLSVSELNDTYIGFVNDMTWTNFDSLNMSGGRCNPWLAQLNNYAPSGGASYGRCGTVAANPLPGYYEKIITYGTNDLQGKNDVSASVGVYKPGSDSSLSFPHWYLESAYARSYPNDGVVPMISAQFNGANVWLRREAFDCDHRYIRRGYEEYVVSPTATYTDWAFCNATGSGVSYPSGISGGYAVSGSIFGVAGGIIETITTVSEIERVFNWAEQAHAGLLQPSGAATELLSGSGFYYRYYPTTDAYVGVKDGNVYFLGRASNYRLLLVGTLADFLGQAKLAGL
jgi:triacylglycerol esterase/lipase EstA (alpha/beta hydrolase family)